MGGTFNADINAGIDQRHLPTINAPLEDYIVPQPLIGKFPDHKLMLGKNANTKVCGVEDGWHASKAHFHRTRTFQRAEVSFLQTHGHERKWWEKRKKTLARTRGRGTGHTQV